MCLRVLYLTTFSSVSTLPQRGRKKNLQIFLLFSFKSGDYQLSGVDPFALDQIAKTEKKVTLGNSKKSQMLYKAAGPGYNSKSDFIPLKLQHRNQG